MARETPVSDHTVQDLLNQLSVNPGPPIYELTPAAARDTLLRDSQALSTSQMPSVVIPKPVEHVLLKAQNLCVSLNVEIAATTSGLAQISAFRVAKDCCDCSKLQTAASVGFQN